ncbi:MAG: hypothetical protein AAGJ35_11785, partial [Myxococcota bacterium]
MYAKVEQERSGVDIRSPSAVAPIRRHLLVKLCCVIFVMFWVVWFAWMCDDAFITFRTIENWHRGLGLRWNVVERVQSYTHPLWMLSVSGLYGLTNEFYYTALMLSFACTLVALVCLCFFTARSGVYALIAAMILGFSRSFVDFSTSGLENPLSHTLLAIFLTLCFRWMGHGFVSLSWGQSLVLFGLATLSVLNRMDTLLLYVPVLIGVMFYLPWRMRRTWCMLLIAVSPFLIWECFSLVYYGFLVPNTAFAKLNHGIRWDALWIQGLHYFAYARNHDTLTLVLMLGCVFFSFVAIFWRRLRVEACVAMGVLLYLLYVVRVGGGFMAGRFFSVPLLATVFLLMRLRLEGMP